MFIRSPPHKLSALSSTLFPHSLLLFPKEHTPPSLLPSIVSHFSSDRQFPTPSSVSQQSCYLSYEISRPLQPFLMDLPGHFPYFCFPSFHPRCSSYFLETSWLAGFLVRVILDTVYDGFTLLLLHLSFDHTKAWNIIAVVSACFWWVLSRVPSGDM